MSIKNLSKVLPAVFIIALILITFVLTKNPLTAAFKLQMSLLSILALIFYGFFLKRKEVHLASQKSFIYLMVATNLFLVGATGWFFSPFFFSLYLMTILLSFLLSPLVSFGFVATLIGLFSVNIGEVDLAYDFLVVLSLLITIPLSLYLRQEYLKLKEGQKDILILEDDKKFESKVEQILSNKINNLAVALRQPVNDVKLMAYRLNKKVKNRDRMITAAEEALRVIKQFEGQSTGKSPKATPIELKPIQFSKTPSPSKPADQG